MIIFERTENTPQYGDFYYDGIKIEITGGYDIKLDDLLHYFVVFLEAMTYPRECIINALIEWGENQKENGNITNGTNGV